MAESEIRNVLYEVALTMRNDPNSPYAKINAEKAAMKARFYEVIDHPYTKRLVGRNYDLYRKRWINIFTYAYDVENMRDHKSEASPVWGWSLWFRRERSGVDILAIFYPFWGLYRRIWRVPVEYIGTACLLLLFCIWFESLRLVLPFALLAQFCWYVDRGTPYFNKIYAEIKRLEKMPPNEAETYVARHAGGSWLWACLGGVLFLVVLAVALVMTLMTAGLFAV